MLGRFQLPLIATEVGQRVAFHKIKQGRGNLLHSSCEIMVKGSHLVIYAGVGGCQTLLHGLIFREVYAPEFFPAMRGPVPDRGRHPGPGHRTPETPADTYAGACRSPGYIRCGLQRKGTSGSSKIVTILCWSIVGGKRLCVLACFSHSLE